MVSPQKIVELATALPGCCSYIFHRWAVPYLATNISEWVWMTWKASEAHFFFAVQLIQPPQGCYHFPTTAKALSLLLHATIRALSLFVHWWLILLLYNHCCLSFKLWVPSESEQGPFPSVYCLVHDLAPNKCSENACGVNGKGQAMVGWTSLASNPW